MKATGVSQVPPWTHEGQIACGVGNGDTGSLVPEPSHNQIEGLRVPEYGVSVIRGKSAPDVETGPAGGFVLR
jgi:hypothetical protein